VLPAVSREPQRCQEQRGQSIPALMVMIKYLGRPERRCPLVGKIVLMWASSRNGYTGEIVLPEPGTPRKRGPTRVRRARLQAALAAQVPQGIIKFNKKLVSLQDLEDGGVTLEFADGTNTTADLVVGGDGVRSVCSAYNAVGSLSYTIFR